MKKYSGDPKWIRARFGKCEECGKSLKGERALFYPIGRHVYCEGCGDAMYREFLANCEDENFMSGNYY